MQPTSAKNDPWVPLNGSRRLNSQANDDENDCVLGAPSFVALLEAKLARVKGKSREPSSKEMIKCLTSAKECQLQGMLGESASPYVSNHDYETSPGAGATSLGALQRRLRPEQALTEEELRKLVDDDELAKQLAAFFDGEDIKLSDKTSDIHISDAGSVCAFEDNYVDNSKNLSDPSDCAKTTENDETHNSDTANE